MQQIGPKGLTRKHVAAVAATVPFGAKTAKEYRWPLDVGERTLNQLLDLAPWMKRATIESRLNRGERRLEALIARPDPVAIKAGNRARMIQKIKKDRKERVIAYDRRQYLARMKAGHKEL